MDIYGHFFSVPSNQVRLSAAALGCDANYHHVDLMTGQNQTPEYLAINRAGKIPALVDGDFKLAESNAICRYLGCKNESALYPDSLEDRAQIDQWMEFSAHHIRANMSKVLFNKMFAPMMDMPVDEKSMAEGAQFLERYLTLVNAELENRACITGDNTTLADVALVSAMDPFEKIDISLEPYPNVQRWRQAQMSQPYYQSVHHHYGAELEA